MIRDTSNEDNVKVYLIQDEECKTYVIGAKGIKPVEYKLYDCNGVELKEGDEVYNIALDDGYTYIQHIKLIDGILCNNGLNLSHRADRNDGKQDNKDSLYRWKVLKK